MTKPKPPTSAGPTSLVANQPEERKGLLKTIGGSRSDTWNSTLADQAVQSLWLANSDAAERDRQLSATVAALAGIAPQDELEGMMAAQLVAAHNAAMECHRRAMLAEQPPEGRRENLNQATKLSRTWATLLEALNRHRGKGQQRVTVEHVHVHAGGRAVVGLVEAPGGGDRPKLEEQPHARQIAPELGHASEPALRCEDAEPDAVPVAGDGERPLPHAWGNVSGRTGR